MAWIYYITFAGFMCAVLAQTDIPSFDTPISLPPELQGKIKESDIENLRSKYLEQFKNKCEKNGHPEIFDSIQTAFITFMNCTNKLIDMNTLEKEIEAAKPNGKVDEVFKTYCGKTPDFKKCFRDVAETIKPCFAADEQKNFKTVYNVTDQLVEFICYKDGDRIALFIAEGGKECFQDKQEQVQNCLNSTFDSQDQSNLQNITVDGVLNLEFKEKQCNQMTKLQKCVVSALESCDKPTSGNIVEALFNFVRKATPCKAFNKAEKSSTRSAATGLTLTSATIFVALVTALLV